MQAVLSNPNRIQSQGEEIANSISHGAGLVGALVGTPFLVMHAVRQGDAGFIVGTSVFCASMIILYLASRSTMRGQEAKPNAVFGSSSIPRSLSLSPAPTHR
jgi:hemolysin III